MRDRSRRRRAIQQPKLALCEIAPHPLASAADADLGGRGRLAQRPLPIHNPTAQPATAFQTESSVSVKLHPVSSLGLRCVVALSLQGGPDGPTYSGTTPSSRVRDHACLSPGRVAADAAEILKLNHHSVRSRGVWTGSL